MTYKTILVHFDNSRRAHLRLECALKLAVTHQAHLTGMYAAHTPPQDTLFVSEETADWYARNKQRRIESRGALERLFHAESKRAGVNAEWRPTNRDANVAVPQAARCADLVIAGQTDIEDSESYIAPHFTVHLTLAAGRPVLLLPCAGQLPHLGSHVMVAWDGSREAARAVQDALPFLQTARQVTVVMVQGKSTSEPRLDEAELAHSLTRHHVNAVFSHIKGVAHYDIGDALLARARYLGADLIVMGAYGHQRWLEFVYGGATFSAMQSMTVPILFSH